MNYKTSSIYFQVEDEIAEHVGVSSKPRPILISVDSDRQTGYQQETVSVEQGCAMHYVVLVLFKYS